MDNRNFGLPISTPPTKIAPAPPPPSLMVEWSQRDPSEPLVPVNAQRVQVILGTEDHSNDQCFAWLFTTGTTLVGFYHLVGADSTELIAQLRQLQSTDQFSLVLWPVTVVIGSPAGSVAGSNPNPSGPLGAPALATRPALGQAELTPVAVAIDMLQQQHPTFVLTPVLSEPTSPTRSGSILTSATHTSTNKAANTAIRQPQSRRGVGSFARCAVVPGVTHLKRDSITFDTKQRARWAWLLGVACTLSACCDLAPLTAPASSTLPSSLVATAAPTRLIPGGPILVGTAASPGVAALSGRARPAVVAALTIGALINQLADRANQLLQAAQNVGLVLEVQASSQAVTVIASMQQALSQLLDQAVDQLTAAQQKAVSDIESILDNINNHTLKNVDDLADQFQDIINAVPFADHFPQVAGYSATYAFAGGPDTITLRVRGNFFDIGKSGFDPVLDVGGQLVKHTVKTTTALEFAVPKSAILVASKRVEYLSGTLRIPYSHSCAAVGTCCAVATFTVPFISLPGGARNRQHHVLAPGPRAADVDRYLADLRVGFESGRPRESSVRTGRAGLER